jgi:hypothetical protein
MSRTAQGARRAAPRPTQNTPGFLWLGLPAASANRDDHDKRHPPLAAKAYLKIPSANQSLHVLCLHQTSIMS